MHSSGGQEEQKVGLGADGINGKLQRRMSWCEAQLRKAEGKRIFTLHVTGRAIIYWDV